MSIIDAFDDRTEEMIRPGLIAEPIEGFPETVILTFSTRVIDYIRESFPCEEISRMSAGVAVPVYKFAYKGRELGAYLTALGGSAAVALMEEVLAKGAKNILAFGSCGVLDRGITAGHLLIPTAAYRDEGTSYHYMPAGDWVEAATADRLGEIFDGLTVPYIRGKTWTTDGFYRETRGNVERRRADGCVAVEMECASIMAAGQFRGAGVYQFLYAADSLDGEEWDSRLLGAVPGSSVERYTTVALETAIRI